MESYNIYQAFYFHAKTLRKFAMDAEKEKLRGISRSDRITKNIEMVKKHTEKKEKASDTNFQKNTEKHKIDN